MSQNTPPTIHILMHARYNSKKGLPTDLSDMKGTPHAYYLTREAALEELNLIPLFDYPSDMVQRYGDAGQGVAHSVVYRNEKEGEGFAWWVYSGVERGSHESTAKEILGFSDDIMQGGSRD